MIKVNIYNIAFICIIEVMLLVHCAKRDNPHDPQSAYYVNLAPTISLTLSYDTTRVQKTEKSDTLFFWAPSIVSVAAEVRDDYEQFGKPILKWTVVANDSEIETISDSNKIVFEVVNRGIYKVRVHAIDNEGKSSDTCFSFYAQFKKGEFRPKYFYLQIQPDSGAFPLEVKFYAIQFDNSVTAKKYLWDFGDGNLMVSDSPFIKHTYYYPGIFPVKVIIHLSATNSDIDVDTVVVTSKFIEYPKYILDFSVRPNPAQIGDTVTFWVVTDPRHPRQFSYVWYFPTDTVSTNASTIKRSFTKNGYYQVKVKVDDGTSKPVTLELTLIVLPRHADNRPRGF